MKRTSIVSIIVAASIIIVGIVLCLIGNSMAKSSGNLLFPEVRGEDSVKTVPLDKNVIKIHLDCADADVNVYGSSSSSYIEFVNFSETFYSLAVNNTSVTFKETPDIKSLFTFWENGFSFSGMRHILNPKNYDNSKMKEINIYLSSDSAIKQFELAADETSVTLENLSLAADYVIRANHLKFYASSVKTNSSLKINVGAETVSSESAQVELRSSSFNLLNVIADEIDFSAVNTDSLNASITAKSGLIAWDIPKTVASFTYIADPEINLETRGTIRLNGETLQDSFHHKSSSEEPRVFSIHAGEADITVSGLSYFETPTPEETEDAQANTTNSEG